MVRKKHVPQRTCVACRTVSPKRDLIRVVRTSEGSVIVDETGKAQGRGAYLCRNAGCWEEGLSRNAIGRALRVTLTDEDRSALKMYVADLV